MQQSYDKSRASGVSAPGRESDFCVDFELPEGAIEEVIKISRRRAEYLGNMKDALLRDDIEKVRSIAEVLCGLAEYE